MHFYKEQHQLRVTTIMSSNEPPQVEEQTVNEDQKTFKVETTTQGKRYLQLPENHLATAGLKQGDMVGIKPLNYNGEICLAISADGSDGLSRKIREPHMDPDLYEITIPKRLATAAQLTGEEVSYISRDGRIVAMIDHDPMFSRNIEAFNVTKVLMSRLGTGSYAYYFPQEITEKLLPGDTVWFSYDVLGDGFIFVIDTQKENAPETAIGLSVQESNTSDAEYEVNLPKQICESLSLSGEYIKWGHDGHSKVMGLIPSSP